LGEIIIGALPLPLIAFLRLRALLVLVPQTQLLTGRARTFALALAIVLADALPVAIAVPIAGLICGEQAATGDAQNERQNTHHETERSHRSTSIGKRE